MKLNEQITQLRRERKMSQEELAEILQVSRQSVSKWENGLSNLDTENLIRLAEIFQVDVNLLIGSRLEGEERQSRSTPPNQGKMVRILCVLLMLFVSTTVLFAVLLAVDREGEYRIRAADEQNNPWESLQFYVGDAAEEVRLTRKERKNLYQLVNSTDSENWTVTENPEMIIYDGFQYLVACQVRNADIFLIYTDTEVWNIQIFPSGKITLYRAPITSDLLAELQRYAEK